MTTEGNFLTGDKMFYANSILGGFLFALGFFLANVLVQALFHKAICS
jgi:hypothetical protein